MLMGLGQDCHRYRTNIFVGFISGLANWFELLIFLKEFFCLFSPYVSISHVILSDSEIALTDIRLN